MPRDSNMGAQTNGGDSPSPSQPRRPAFRTDPRQFLRPKSPSDGPWSVSVAEYDGDFSLYIKSPTHNFTLTRTAAELVDFDRKLKEAYPDAPVLPLDLANLEKRRPKSSTFLNTLTRLASPKPRSTRSPSTPDASDPFLAYGDIASYLTTISNTPSMHQARVWKRFIRVRTDDLESVRVERAIKRVRSTEAAIRDAVPRPHIPRVLRHRRRVGETEKGEDEDVDVFDGRHSVPIADEDEESDGSGDEGKGYVE
ncbi:hypothetical protein C8F04DRAFT_989690 [Mycena alexandri]|uniref:Uncharacterized protein n=1 Tax=Mycena alexandri TaxID=1745969 RepID=A0AAD6THH1_9AGAR|nr:hypothetical protein C8F04DRAFT_989690 [Mycena alexandri]